MTLSRPHLPSCLGATTLPSKPFAHCAPLIGPFVGDPCSTLTQVKLKYWTTNPCQRRRLPKTARLPPHRRSGSGHRRLRDGAHGGGIDSGGDDPGYEWVYFPEVRGGLFSERPCAVCGGVLFGDSRKRSSSGPFGEEGFTWDPGVALGDFPQLKRAIYLLLSAVLSGCPANGSVPEYPGSQPRRVCLPGKRRGTFSGGSTGRMEPTRVRPHKHPCPWFVNNMPRAHGHDHSSPVRIRGNTSRQTTVLVVDVRRPS